ncbi:MAG: gamma-glutamylcyclotransferase family protein [Nanoarchaeota archaeon]
MSEKNVMYFGYGANAHKDMIKALIGRTPKGFKAKLRDYGLFIQSWLDIPLEAKKTLEEAWDESFSSYIAVPLKGVVVWGTAWEITEKERAVIGEWELHHKWYLPVKIKIVDEKGKISEAETEIIPRFYTKVSAIQEKEYPHFPNDKAKMLKLARKLRKDFLKKTT